MQSFKFLVIILLVILLTCCQCQCQSNPQTSNRARELDALLQEYAYRTFPGHPRTGFVYDGHTPSNLTGIGISVVRLRTGSLKTRGFRNYKEFRIPDGVVAEPYVERLAFVYQNLGNWSSVYYPLPGYTFLAPVLGLLAYSAANLSGANLQELDVEASGLPILINFGDVRRTPSVLTAKCVRFDLAGVVDLSDMVSSAVCSTGRQGHFSIVVNSMGLPPAPAPDGAIIPRPTSGKSHKSKTKVWKIAGAVVGGFVVLVLLVLLLVCLHRCSGKKKMADMEQRADAGEALQMSRVGNTLAPVASGTRTLPVLENEYASRKAVAPFFG